MDTELLKRGIARVAGERATEALRQAYWQLLARSPVRLSPGTSLGDEVELIDELLRSVPLCQTFCEFGFHIRQFNCARLVSRRWRGLLIDGDKANVDIARHSFARSKLDNVVVLNAFLTADNVLPIVSSHFEGVTLGILSVDIDGNDYWVLKRLLPLQPQLVIVEYNASLGLRPLSVPYDPEFDRHKKHPSGWYHGASITALASLCGSAGYSLVKVSEDGLNLFFLRNELLAAATPALDPAAAYRENRPRNKRSGSSAAEQWQLLQSLPFVDVLEQREPA